MVKGFKAANFDESMEIHLKLGIDVKKSDQQVRGTFVFPHGVGKSKRVIVFAEGAIAEEAQEAGALEVGGEELAKKIQDEGWLDFDRVIATPDMMGVVGKLGRVLGPRGLMPNPKLGTVTPDVGRAVGEQKSGKVEYRVDKTGIVHCDMGTRAFEASQWLANLGVLIDAIERARAAATKGTYMKSIALSSTMGPGLRIEPSSALALRAD